MLHVCMLLALSSLAVVWGECCPLGISPVILVPLWITPTQISVIIGAVGMRNYYCAATCSYLQLS